MASHVYNIAKSGFMGGTIDLDTHVIKVTLVMTNTTADTQVDANFMPGGASDPITTLDEMDGGYSGDFAGSDRKTLSVTVSVDDTDDEGVFDATDVTWTALAAGTRSVDGAVIYKHITSEALSIPIAWIDFSPDVVANGGDLTIQWNSEGIINLN